MTNKETKSSDDVEVESPERPTNTRERVKKTLRIYDNFPPFTRAEAVILEILSEEDEWSVVKIMRKLTVDGDIIEGCNPTSVSILLGRLRFKRLVTMRKQSRLAFFRPSKKGRTLFRIWKSFGEQFLSELDS